MRDKSLRDDVIKDVCARSELDPDLIHRLLGLEGRHRDLLAWGSRPNLRRDIAAVMEDELQKRRESSRE